MRTLTFSAGSIKPGLHTLAITAVYWPSPKGMDTDVATTTTKKKNLKKVKATSEGREVVGKDGEEREREGKM